MNIELNQTDIKLIEDALDAWEKDASSSALFTTMLGAMLPGKEPPESRRQHSEAEIAKAMSETQRRRRVGTMLRAKIYQAQTAIAVESAFTNTTKET